MPAATPSTGGVRSVSSVPRWRVWFNAVRPRSFTTSTVPIVAATALAMVDGAINPWLFILMLIASIFTHAACNLTNDYFDDRRGVDSSVTLGQGGALQRGDLTHDDLRKGIMVSFGIAILAAVPVIAAVGPVVLWIGLFSAAAAYLYTAGPFPLAYWALGEVTVFLTMGIGMVCGAYYVLRGDVSTPAILLGAAIGMLAAAFLHANNMRDVETDRAMHKRTLAEPAATRPVDRVVCVPALHPLRAGHRDVRQRAGAVPGAARLVLVPDGLQAGRARRPGHHVGAAERDHTEDGRTAPALLHADEPRPDAGGAHGAVSRGIVRSSS
ncbi:MAG: 1,4-dihydroxy-2-naphthoate octaprenyltransferase [Thermomicrobiales bacterium]